MHGPGPSPAQHDETSWTAAGVLAAPLAATSSGGYYTVIRAQQRHPQTTAERWPDRRIRCRTCSATCTGCTPSSESSHSSVVWNTSGSDTRYGTLSFFSASMALGASCRAGPPTSAKPAHGCPLSLRTRLSQGKLLKTPSGWQLPAFGPAAGEGTFVCSSSSSVQGSDAKHENPSLQIL